MGSPTFLGWCVPHRGSKQAVPQTAVFPSVKYKFTLTTTLDIQQDRNFILQKTA